ncbi:TVP38/TMEM64 family protein [Thiohalophilus thiocyanatoxydans]|uniref:TVP38/TMEM64 family membrane protein n=1 Tax=Thiohalophilus thiocyanatoxydans TaxID=381308 RepID=A0A4R8IS12_9GAMM|nr:VTT domain-containing protein [Thiohalophilus thiocyanatoxydans]TDY03822.1 putative membrane protein YdjX (TVP38/TMEM64 family) [Thiohalophilus thiocyanatoxydans]
MKLSPVVARLLLLGAIVIALIGGYLILARSGAIAFLENGPALQAWLQQLGIIGPLAIIGLMTLAIVMSPIPSAPIALAAGAAYGHTEGTVYVLIGAELGAIIAFIIARLAGLAVVQHWLGPGIMQRLHGSQNMLMLIVFVSRLLPFISFDMVSYAAGVTPLRFWRFVVATFAGIIPASFLLAHFGAEMASGESERIGITLLLLGGVSLLVILLERFSRRRR